MSETVAGVPSGEIVRLAPDVWTEPFWEAAREHRLVCMRCGDCGTFRMPPSPMCHECHSQSVQWVELDGRGTVYTFTVIRRALIPVLEASVPYVVAVVELAGAPGARLVSNVIEVDPADVTIGLDVEVAWDDVSPEVTIPRFRPSGR